MKKYIEHFEVLFHDVDVNGNIRPSELIRYLQETADHQMRDRKPSYTDLLDRGIALIVTRMVVEMLTPLKHGDMIEVRTWSNPAKRATLRRCYEIFRGEELCVRGYSEWASVDFVNNTLVPADAIDFSTYESGEPHEMNIPKKFRIPSGIEMRHAGIRTVRYEDTDTNGHMNNTYYPNFLWGLIPDVGNKVFTSVNIRFLHEGTLGSDLEIYHADAPLDLAKDPNAEEVHAFETKVDGEKNVEILIGVRQLRSGR